MGTITVGDTLGALAQLGQSLTDSGNVSEDLLEFNRETAVVDTTELICKLMKEQGVSRATLADRMGKSKSYVTQLLKGSQNMTLRTISDVFTHLGKRFEASYEGKRPRVHTSTSLSYAVITHVTTVGDSSCDLNSTLPNRGPLLKISQDQLPIPLMDLLGKALPALPS